MERNQQYKFDGNKPMMELLPPIAITELAKVLTYGAKKYSPESWRKVEMPRYIGALLRHTIAVMQDPQSIDEESGLFHASHLLANAAFIAETVALKRPDMDVPDKQI